MSQEKSILALSMACTLGLTSASALADSSVPTLDKPNVLFIVVDDLNSRVGYERLHPMARTPNIDRLAASGIAFTNAHAAAPVCVASRAAFMSGVHPVNSGLYSNAGWESAHEVIPDTPHMAELFKNAGYTNVGAGKVYHSWVTDSSAINKNNQVPVLHDKFYDSYLDPEAVMPTKSMLPDGEGYGMKDTGRGNKYYPFPVDGTRLGNELNIKKGTSLAAGAVPRDKMRDGLMPDEVIASWGVNELKTLEQQPRHKPFFMALGFIRPHLPFTAPKEYFDMFPLEQIALPQVADMSNIPLYGKAMTMGTIPGGDHAAVEKLGEQFWKELIQGYLASTAFVDDQIGKVLDQLDASGLKDTTMVVLMSDHGQNLGEKKNWRKMSLWEESTKAPLIIRLPGDKHAGKKVSSAVSLLDIYPTFAEVMGAPIQAHADGNSLVPLLNNPEANWDKPVLISWQYKNFAIRSNEHRYIQYRDGTAEFYNNAQDPFELNNLIDSPKVSALVEKYKAMIPSDVKLPYRKQEGFTDKLDRYVTQFKNTENQPSFLRSTTKTTNVN